MVYISTRVYNRGEEREYRTWIFKMLSKSRAPGIDHSTADVFRRAYTAYTDAVGHVTLHLNFNGVILEVRYSLSSPLLYTLDINHRTTTR
jgi:hypothetical protein